METSLQKGDSIGVENWLSIDLEYGGIVETIVIQTSTCVFSDFALATTPSGSSISSTGTIYAGSDTATYPAPTIFSTFTFKVDAGLSTEASCTSSNELAVKIYSLEGSYVTWTQSEDPIKCPIGSTNTCSGILKYTSSTITTNNGYYPALSGASFDTYSTNSPVWTTTSGDDTVVTVTFDATVTQEQSAETVSYVAGTETISKTLNVYFYNCTDYLTWSTTILTTITVQMGGSTTLESYLTSTSSNCPINFMYGGVFSITPAATSGVTISGDIDAGTITISSTSAQASVSMLSYYTIIGIVFTSHSWSYEIVDCLEKISFSGAQSTNTVQVDQQLVMATSLTTTDTTTCAIGSYSLSSTVAGITIDSNTGQITVSSATAIVQTSFTISSPIGTVPQTYTTTAFTIEVFDCTNKITFEKILTSYTSKVGGVFPTIDATATTSDTTNCPITANSYTVTTDATFITMASDGTFTVDTSSQKSSTSTIVSVTTGYQTFSSASFKSSVYLDDKVIDCTSYLVFTQLSDRIVAGSKYYIFMVLSSQTDLKINAVATTNDAKNCAIGTYAISNQPEDSNFDTSTGILSTPVKSISTSPYFLNITATIGSNSVTAEFEIRVTEAVNFRPLFLGPLVDWMITKGSNDTEYSYFAPQMKDLEGDAISYEIVSTGGLKNLQDRLIVSNDSLVFTLNPEDAQVGSYQISIILSDSKRGTSQNLNVLVEEEPQETEQKKEQKEEQTSLQESPQNFETVQSVEIKESLKTDQEVKNETVEEVIPPPAPFITKYDFKPSGELSVKFNLDMAEIDPTKDLNEAMEIILDAPDYDTQVIATWINPQDKSAKARRSLQRELQDDDEDNQLAGVGWYIDSQDPRDLKMKLEFEDLDQAHYYENVEVNIKDPSAFPSADGITLDNTKKQAVSKPIYMYIDEGETAQIEAIAESAKGAAVTSGLLTFILSKLLGAGMQCIWSMMSVLQEISFNSLMNMKYKPRVMYVMETMTMFSKVDVISLENYWADNWEFVETNALNYKFDIQGMDSKNFLINTGSMLVNFSGMLGFSLLFQVLHKSLKNRAWKSRKARRIMAYNLAPSMLTGTIMFLYQFSTDAIICASLQFKAYKDNGLAIFLDNPGDILNLVGSIAITLSVIFLTTASIFVIQKTEKLDDDDFQLKYFMFIDGLDLKTRAQAQYNNIIILRYVMNASIFIWIHQGCIQSQILLFSSVMFLILIIDVSPFDNALGNQLGIFNYTMVYLTLIVQFFLGDGSRPSLIQDNLGNIYIILVIIALVINFCIAMIQMYSDYKEERRLKHVRKAFLDRWKELSQELKNKSDDARKEHQYFQVLQRQMIQLEMKDLNEALVANGWKPIKETKSKGVMVRYSVKTPKYKARSYAQLRRNVRQEKQREVKIINGSVMAKCEEAEAARDRENTTENPAVVHAKFARNSLGRPVLMSFSGRQKQRTTIEGIKLAKRSRQQVKLTVVDEEQHQATARQASSSHSDNSQENSGSHSSSSCKSSSGEDSEKENQADNKLAKIEFTSLKTEVKEPQLIDEENVGFEDVSLPQQTQKKDLTIHQQIILKAKQQIDEKIKQVHKPHKNFDQSDALKQFKQKQEQYPDDFDEFEKLALKKLVRQQMKYRIKLQYRYEKCFPDHKKDDAHFKERKFRLFKEQYDQKIEENYQEELRKGEIDPSSDLPIVKFTDKEIEQILKTLAEEKYWKWLQ